MEQLLNSSQKVVGTKQVLRGIKAGSIVRVYVANDADTYLYTRVVEAAERAEIPVKRVATMKELGKVAGVDVAAAAAGICR